MKKFIIIFTLMVISIFISGCNNESSDNVLIIGFSPDYPPFNSKNKSNFSGFDVDLIKIIEKELNVKIILKDMSFDNIIPSLKANKIHLGISSINPTEKRKSHVDFSHLYYISKFALLTKKSNDLDIKKHHTIGVQLGSTMENAIKQSRYKDVSIKSLNNNLQILEELTTDKINSIITEESQAKLLCKKKNNMHYKVLSLTDNIEGYAIAAKKNSSLIPKINKIIEKIKDDGTLQTLYIKWEI